MPGWPPRTLKRAYVNAHGDDYSHVSGVDGISSRRTQHTPTQRENKGQQYNLHTINCDNTFKESGSALQSPRGRYNLYWGKEPDLKYGAIAERLAAEQDEILVLFSSLLASFKDHAHSNSSETWRGHHEFYVHFTVVINICNKTERRVKQRYENSGYYSVSTLE